MKLSIDIVLPEWLQTMVSAKSELTFPTATDKMKFTIDIARRNVKEKSGGPFGAAVFDEADGTLIAAAGNAVVQQRTSIAHAETLAITLAQHRLNTFDLAHNPDKNYSLYASGQPCIMCYGVIWWSGITKLVCAARGEDVEGITGFREGPMTDDWPSLLEQRKGLPRVTVIRDLLRGEACEVLREYANSDLPVYNAGSTRTTLPKPNKFHGT